VDDARIGRTIRALRMRRGWRQIDLASRAGISRSAISDLERGRAERYTVAATRRVLRALDATVELYLNWGGHGELDRLLDADHASVVTAWAEGHLRAGWDIWPEASYSIYGERGRIDLLAFHPTTGTLEVAECKTGIWDLQDLLGRLDAKVRLAPKVAAERGWPVRRVVPALVVADGRTARRRVEQYPALFDRFDTRGWAAKAWVQDPSRPAGGVLAFVKLPDATTGRLRRAGRRRVRLRRAAVARSPPQALP
jgi:transcriptional regulator with XRE-family HTH domain